MEQNNNDNLSHLENDHIPIPLQLDNNNNISNNNIIPSKQKTEKNDTLIKLYKSLNCIHNEHYYKPTSKKIKYKVEEICINPECNKDILMCVKCQLDTTVPNYKHANHEKIQLSKFLETVVQEARKEYPEDINLDGNTIKDTKDTENIDKSNNNSTKFLSSKTTKKIDQFLCRMHEAKRKIDEIFYTQLHELSDLLYKDHFKLMNNSGYKLKCIFDILDDKKQYHEIESSIIKLKKLVNQENNGFINRSTKSVLKKLKNNKVLEGFKDNICSAITQEYKSLKCKILKKKKKFEEKLKSEASPKTKKPVNNTKIDPESLIPVNTFNQSIPRKETKPILSSNANETKPEIQKEIVQPTKREINIISSESIDPSVLNLTKKRNFHQHRVTITAVLSDSENDKNNGTIKVKKEAIDEELEKVQQLHRILKKVKMEENNNSSSIKPNFIPKTTIQALPNNNAADFGDGNVMQNINGLAKQNVYSNGEIQKNVRNNPMLKYENNIFGDMFKGRYSAYYCIPNKNKYQLSVEGTGGDGLEQEKMKLYMMNDEFIDLLDINYENKFIATSTNNIIKISPINFAIVYDNIKAFLSNPSNFPTTNPENNYNQITSILGYIGLNNNKSRKKFYLITTHQNNVINLWEESLINLDTVTANTIPIAKPNKIRYRILSSYILKNKIEYYEIILNNFIIVSTKKSINSTSISIFDIQENQLNLVSELSSDLSDNNNNNNNYNNYPNNTNDNISINYLHVFEPDIYNNQKKIRIFTVDSKNTIKLYELEYFDSFLDRKIFKSFQRKPNFSYAMPATLEILKLDSSINYPESLFYSINTNIYKFNINISKIECSVFQPQEITSKNIIKYFMIIDINTKTFILSFHDDSSIKLKEIKNNNTVIDCGYIQSKISWYGIEPNVQLLRRANDKLQFVTLSKDQSSLTGIDLITLYLQ